MEYHVVGTDKDEPLSLERNGRAERLLQCPQSLVEQRVSTTSSTKRTLSLPHLQRSSRIAYTSPRGATNMDEFLHCFIAGGVHHQGRILLKRQSKPFSETRARYRHTHNLVIGESRSGTSLAGRNCFIPIVFGSGQFNFGPRFMVTPTRDTEE